MRPPALMRGPSRKPRCQHSGGPVSRAASISAVRPTCSRRRIAIRPFETKARLSPLSGTTSATVPSATRSSRVEQVRLGAQHVPEAALAQLAVDRDHGHEHEADGREMVEPGQIVLPVRVDQRIDRRQAPRRPDDGRSITTSRPSALRLGERLDAGGAAIDRDRAAARPSRRARAPPRCSAHSLRTAGPECGSAARCRHGAGTSPARPPRSRRRRRSRRRSRSVSRRSIASAMRAAAFGMSVSVSGSGISRRTVGSRNSSTASTSTSRPASTRASSSDTPWRCAIASARALAALVEPVAPDAPAHRWRTSRKSREPPIMAPM